MSKVAYAIGKDHVLPSVLELMEFVFVIKDTFYLMVNVYNVHLIPIILAMDAHACLAILLLNKHHAVLL